MLTIAIIIQMWVIINILVVIPHIQKLVRPTKVKDVYQSTFNIYIHFTVYVFGVLSYLVLPQLRWVVKSEYDNRVLEYISICKTNNINIDGHLMLERNIKLSKLTRKIKIKKLKKFNFK